MEIATRNAILKNEEYRRLNAAKTGRLTMEIDLSLFPIPVEKISSSGYVVHTPEAAVWCLVNFNTYADTVLKAVNLGEDTDTTAAVAGGLAGLYYGASAIPQSWKDQLARKEYICKMCETLAQSLL